MHLKKMRLAQGRAFLALSVAHAIFLFFFLPQYAQTTDECQKCLNNCGSVYCAEKKYCDEMTAGVAKQECYLVAQRNKEICIINCNTGGGCEGEEDTNDPCFVSGHTDTCIRTPY